MITVVAYDPGWPHKYAIARDELMAALGKPLLAIEHTGSTSVPGLAAKPVIDICAATADLEAIRAQSAMLRSAGYEAEDFGAPDRLFYVRRDDLGHRSHHLHVFPVERWELLKERILPAHLRKYPEAARRYGELKQQLAQSGLDREAYTRGKTQLIQELMDTARAERGLPSEPVWEE